MRENPVARQHYMWKDFGRRIGFKLADESLLGIEELDSQVSLRDTLCSYFERFVIDMTSGEVPNALTIISLLL